MDIAVAIYVGSPNSTITLVRRTIESIMKNIGTEKYQFIISLGEKIKDEISSYIIEMSQAFPGKFHIFGTEEIPWAAFINKAIDYASGCRFFIVSHDDIDLLTPNFYTKLCNYTDMLAEPIGWISFTDKDYLNRHWAPSTRPGYHSDAEKGWKEGKLFQFHKLPKNWWKSYHWWRIENKLEDLLDVPERPVKCHAPFSHFVAIKYEILKKIGYCENWGTGESLLIDEDWGLRALELGLFNIWIPSIAYIHNRLNLPNKLFRIYNLGRIEIVGPSKSFVSNMLGSRGATRAWSQINQHSKKVHDLFIKKWGFDSDPTSDEIKIIKARYGNTNITWSMDKYSFEWDYIQ